ncbi:hypothetical protein ASG12_06835 [Williamsia sp. Leaf354]|uniref:DUF309 domain-containing protein n=1 Tax=Williamsia sp. Leaf354 TaxID=1736349 RepID=UPI0006FFB65E|nr:DUF309 domain-containing protein [Williamsia sp. Leaf354]KQS00591.1 hypothetical protein ASG12_06835 [Williamsia sp. Leaf354]
MTATGGERRDRDPDGRPRNARPRDGLGRPLPRGAEGVPRAPEGVVRSVSETIEQAQELLNSGRPFHAHEVFEDAWKAARDRGAHDAELWKSLAQLAVGLTHRLRGRPVGADRLLRRGAQGLRPFTADPPYGLDVAGLVAWAAVPDTTDPPRLR